MRVIFHSKFGIPLSDNDDCNVTFFFWKSWASVTLLFIIDKYLQDNIYIVSNTSYLTPKNLTPSCVLDF